MPSTLRFRGDAPAVAQVDTYTVGNPSIGSTYSITAGTKVFIYTAASTTASTVAAALVAAYTRLRAILYPEFSEVTAAVSAGAVITFTADEAGNAFEFTYAAGGAGAPTFSGSTTTASEGPYHWDTDENWTGGVKPA